MDERWTRVQTFAEQRSERLAIALKDAEKFHKSAHTLLEWLSDVESRLKFTGALPDNEHELNVSDC
jgi:hypothetical protein